MVVSETEVSVIVETAGNPENLFQTNHARIVAEFEEFLEDTWPEVFTFDRDSALETGVIVFLWKKTGQSVPLRFEITEKNFEYGRVNRRELRQQLKDCLPDQIAKSSISSLNSIIRNANRRELTKSFKAVKQWEVATAQLLKAAIGREESQDFLKPAGANPNFSEKSIQALHSYAEEMIDRLKKL